MRFKSKVDLLLSLLVWAAAGSSFVMTVYVAMTGKADAFSVMTTGVIVVFVSWLWFGTYYVVDEKHLIVRAGPINLKIPYGDITSVKSVKTYMAAPALSFDRLEILYGKKDVTYVSPADKAGFIRELEIKRKLGKNDKKAKK